jgi:hypothetical protein
MKWIRYTSLTSLLAFGALVVLLAGCDGLSDFGDLNEDPNATSDPSPDVQFTTLQVGTAGTRFETWRHNLIYVSQTAQLMAHPVLGNGHLNTFNNAWSGALFATRYDGGPNAGVNTVPAAVKTSVDLVNRLEGESAQVNRLAAARIWKVLVFQQLTDTYGDIPYEEAARGAIDGNFKPAYTPQEQIYQDLHDELQAAIDQFDPSKPWYESADLVYGDAGDVDTWIRKWKQFANSLQLRLALRIKGKDPQKAQTWANEAINGSGGNGVGVMEGPEGDVFIRGQDGPSTTPGAGYSRNANSEVFQLGVGCCAPYLSKPFVDWMQDNNDPRLSIVASVDGNTDPAAQRGYPIGVSNAELSGIGVDDPTTTFSGPSSTISSYDAPFFFQTYAEVELMLAEVAADSDLNVSTPKSAEQHYNDGVEAAIKKYERYGATVDQPDVDDYINNQNPFQSSASESEQLDQINTQYWAAVFPHGLEAWSNWRVTGYPSFISPPDQEGETDGAIIRRLAYPQNEQTLNQENYQEARDRQGISQSNRLTARVWWDTELP